MRMDEDSFFKVMADNQRRTILKLLKSGRLSAGELAKELSLSPSALSYHLKQLKSIGCVIEYKSKNYVFYELNTTVFEEFYLWIKKFGGNEK